MLGLDVMQETNSEAKNQTSLSRMQEGTVFSLYYLTFQHIPGPKVIKSFFMLSSTEHEMSIAYKNYNTEKTFLALKLKYMYCIYPANKC